jgi:hypothetical protein
MYQYCFSVTTAIEVKSLKDESENEKELTDRQVLKYIVDL